MSIVKDSITKTLHESMELSMEYSEKIKTAKTAPKSKLYKKKLENNNKVILNLLMNLDKLEKKL